MENDSGAKIAIRGKGSVKEGKGRSDAAHSSNQEEDLHCLIMADTEEKVNKAKQLIHNVIETVSQMSSLQPVMVRTNTNSHTRQLLFLKAKTNSNEISFENSPLSTVLFVMTKTKLARTVARSGTGNTTALSDRTLPPVSFAVFVVMLAIWPETVPTGREAPTGVITTLADDLQAGLKEAEMPSTVRWRYVAIPARFFQFDFVRY